MKPTKSIIRSAAKGVNKRVIRPTRTGVKNTIIRPTKTSLRSATTCVKTKIIRPATKGVKKVVRQVDSSVGKSKAKLSKQVGKDEDPEGSDYTKSISTLPDVYMGEAWEAEEENNEKADEETQDTKSVFQDHLVVVDGKVDTDALRAILHVLYSEHVVLAQHAQDRDNNDKSAVGPDVYASTLVMTEFHLVEASSDVLDKVRESIETYIFERMVFKSADISTLQVTDVAKLVSFADHYICILAEKGMSASNDKLAFFEELLTEYIRRAVHDPMNKMLAECKTQADKELPRETNDGKLVTGMSDDICLVVEKQLDLATDHLPSAALSDVLAACNTEIHNITSDVFQDLAENGEKYTVERLCSLVNDTVTLIERCEQYNASYLDPNNSDHSTEGEDLLNFMQQLSTHTILTLSKRIMQHMLQEPDPILNRVGTPLWEAQSEAIVQTTITTLDDYFRDIEVWLPEGLYFPLCMKYCFDATLQAYVDAFFVNTTKQGIKNPLVVAQEILNDWHELHNYFCVKEAQAEYLGKAGHHSKDEATRRLGLIRALSSVMVTTPNNTPDKLKSEIATILCLFKAESGIVALLHLVGLRTNHRTKVEAAEEVAEWHSVTEEVMNTTPRKDDLHPAYTLPHIHKSKYIQQVRSRSAAVNSRLLAIGLDNLSPGRDFVPPRIQTSLGAFLGASRRLLHKDPTLLTTWRNEVPEEEMWKDDDDEEEKDDDDASTRSPIAAMPP